MKKVTMRLECKVNKPKAYGFRLKIAVFLCKLASRIAGKATIVVESKFDG